MKKDWFISHSCHTKEPFGYSIFQSIDYGKLPIIHSDWGDVDYKYKGSSKEEFDYVLKQIQNDSYDENENQILINLNHICCHMIKKKDGQKELKQIF